MNVQETIIQAIRAFFKDMAKSAEQQGSVAGDPASPVPAGALLAELGPIENLKITLERPADMSHGDYSANVAMVYGPKLKKSPISLAVQIVEALTKAQSEGRLPGVEKVEVAGPGFINFYISLSVLQQEVAHILGQDKEYGKNRLEAGKKIVFDYTDPNPFKVFHIGHLMTNIIGEAFTRVAEANGMNVMRFCYQGDVGRHVALTIWGLRFMPEHVLMPDDSAPLTEKTAYFGKAYSLGATEFKRLEDEAKATGALDDRGLPTSPEFAVAESQVQKLNKEIYERSNEEVNAIYDKGREWSLEHFEEIYKILGTKFDRYFFESQSAPIGTMLVRDNTAPNGNAIFEESKGAIIFPGEKYGLHTRVFISSNGLPGYEAKDLGLVTLKRGACDFDQSIIITANEQNDYFKVIYKATELLFPELAGKSSHIGHGMMQFASGKMSSRTGNVISGESLLMDMIEMALEKMKDRDMPMLEKHAVAEQVAVAALKYSILRQSSGKNVIFDPAKSLSFEGDSGPYLQYSYVRVRSIMEKASRAGIVANISPEYCDVGLSGLRLMKFLGRYPETVARAWKEQGPHLIANYLMELAGMFNTFYADTQIVKEGDAASPYKVALVEAFSIVLRNGLDVLGIRVPMRM